MTFVKNWISAARPRTLFLAVATVVLGSGLAMHDGSFSGAVFGLTLVLAISVQILSNFANDLGDYQKGTDTTGRRQGPTRAVQGGKISARQMKQAIGASIAVCATIGFVLIKGVIGKVDAQIVALLAGVGLASILAALFYTVGKRAYGYKGWGDFFAFLFFGPVAVIGTYFLHTHTLCFRPVLPAAGMGLISAMILNVNNMRDIENDRASGKITVAVKLGLRNAKIYHTLLTFGVFTCFLQYSFLYAHTPWYRYAYAVIFLFQFVILTKIHQRQGRELDPFLRLTALSGFLLAMVFVGCINV